MGKTDLHIILLLRKYIHEKCSSEELRELLLWLRDSEHDEELSAEAFSLWNSMEKNEVLPARRRILEQKAENLLRRLEKEKNKTMTVFVKKMAAAAIITIVILLGLWSRYISSDLPVESYYTETTDFGERKEIILSDSTTVILNSKTKLKIPATFIGEVREVELDGEAFFEVAKDSNRPFIIHSGNAKVQVLGTSFDIKSYKEDQYFAVTVISGKVLVDVNKGDLSVKLVKNERLVQNKMSNTFSMCLQKSSEHIKWISGVLYFHKEPISEVIHTLARAYNKKIILDTTVQEHLITGTHENRSLYSVLSAICFASGLRFEEHQDIITIYE